jgi:DNA-binding MarR family transcriptional regulator
MNRFYIEAEDTEPAFLLASLQNAARSVRTQVAKNLLSTGLYAGQESIMELLSQKDGHTLGGIAAALGVKPPTVTRTVSRLQEQGFVERYGSEVDARQVHVRLTETGKAVLNNMQDAIARAEEQAFGGLKKKERKQLAKILAKVEQNVAPAAADDANRKTKSKKKRKKSSKQSG